MRLGVLGCAGRMGRALLNAIDARAGCALSGGSERPGHAEIGSDLGVLIGHEPLGLAVHDDPARLIAASDAVIDFSSPEASLRHAALAAEHGAGLVIGTTGFSAGQIGRLHDHSARAKLVVAGNMSLGVNLVTALIERVARALPPAMFDIEIVEMHHKHKVDAPSGTALMLGEAAARGRGVDLAQAKDAARDGHTGARQPGAIGFAVLRGGDVVGEHQAVFAGMGERITLGHIATDRRIFADGAVTAALWLKDRAPGYYTMRDVLGLND